MRKLGVACILIFSLLLQGCYSYNDINRVLFPTAMIIDLDDEGDILIYLEIFHAYRSTQENMEQGQRIIYMQKGVTFLEAIEEFDAIAAHAYSFEHNKAVLFTERAAKEGIEDYLDYVQRGQQFLLRPYVAVYYGNPEELLKTDLKQNEYIGLFIHDLFDRPRTRITMRHRKLYELLNDRQRGKNIVIITALELDQNELQDKIKKYGAAIIKDDRLVDKLGRWEMQYFAFLTDNVDAGRISIAHPQHEDKHLTLEILKSSTKREIIYAEGKTIFNVTVDLKTVMGGSEGSILLDKETIEKIDYLLEEDLKENLEAFFKKYKEKKLDIFGVQETFEIQYPHIEIDNVIEATEIQVEIKNHLSGSPDIVDFR